MDQVCFVVHTTLMDRLPFALGLYLSIYIHIVLLYCSGSSAAFFGNETDKLALLAFKDGITRDPLRVMSSWNDSLHFCGWTGVTCSLFDQRVVVLSLVNQELVGSLSPSLGNLSFLTGINLRNNGFNGRIPEEVGRLTRLQYLNLTHNSFQGAIPVNLTQCLDLRFLDVAYNELKGDIPYQLSYLKNLVSFRIGANNLTGVIPPWIGNYSSLVILSLALNSFHGTIPEALGRLSQLEFFTIFENMLSGVLPPSLYNLSSIYYFSVTTNQLHGRLPPNVGLTLPNLKIFAGGANNFQGLIPDSLSNSSGLQILDFGENELIGSVPVNLGRLQDLIRLNFGVNRLGSDHGDDLSSVITSLVNCSGLEMLGLENNRLRGKLPNSIANLSRHLNILTIGGNLIDGSIPTGIENLVNVSHLGLENNFFNGSIPFGIGKLQKLEIMHFNGNRFTGLIPSSLGNLTLLNSLYIQENRLEGTIPPSLGYCQKLLVLNISQNNLTGTIPKEVLSLSSLSISFSVSHNSLSGYLPLEVGNLINLGELEISENKLSGEVPVTLANCRSLERLKMGGNLFQGTIPMSLRDLRGIQIIDLSHNNISGQIPEFLGNILSLTYLDLSFNDLEGEVPKQGVFTNASAVMVRGNRKLCGGSTELSLPLCAKQAPTSGNFLSWRKFTCLTIGIILLLLLSFFATLYWIRNLRKRSGATAKSSENWHSGASYSDIFKATNGFSSNCLLGEGSFGSVYKGVLSDEVTTFAIKVLNLQKQGAYKCFIAECDALKNIRHRNLIKVITVCSSLDFKGNDFKALVFEFMSNGSLEDWLHPHANGWKQFKSLSFIQRISIAMDVAFGLEYLHCLCETTIVHCDLKPSNILLDEDMIAHVGDFGLARILLETSSDIPKSWTKSAGLKGSIGYIPPEYGMDGQVSTHGDIYSYGILLLEMFTGKRPTGEMFKDGLCLRDFVMGALPNRVMEIVDPLLLNEIESRTEECLVSVIRIGLSCCAPLPKDRMAASDAVSKMNAIRNSVSSGL